MVEAGRIELPSTGVSAGPLRACSVVLISLRGRPTDGSVRSQRPVESRATLPAARSVDASPQMTPVPARGRGGTDVAAQLGREGQFVVGFCVFPGGLTRPTGDLGAQPGFLRLRRNQSPPPKTRAFKGRTAFCLNPPLPSSPNFAPCGFSVTGHAVDATSSYILWGTIVERGFGAVRTLISSNLWDKSPLLWEVLRLKRNVNSLR